MILLAAIFLTQMFTSDIHDKDGQRIGTIKENPSGGYDFYDKNYNRRGYGGVSPYDPGVIELFDSKGSRLGTIRRPTGQDRKR